MVALFMFVLVIALAIALAPIILGVIGTMLGLLFTALLYLFAGCPNHGQVKHADPPAAQAPVEPEARKVPPLHHGVPDYGGFFTDEPDDAERAAKQAAKNARKVGKAAARKARASIDAALLELQRRDPEAMEDGHGKP